MNRKYARSLLASGVIAMLIAAPGWATTDAETQSQLPGVQEEHALQGSGAQAEQGVQQGTSSADSMQPSQSMTEASGPDDETGTDTAAANTDNPLYALTPAELRKMDVVDLTGKEVGKIEAVVRSRDQENIQAVLSSGGILGFGAKEVAVPIDELQLKDERLELSTTKEILESREEYQPERYVDLQPADQPISEFSAFEAVPDEPGRNNMSGQATTEDQATKEPID